MSDDEGECDRCSAETTETMLDGTFRCSRCQRQVAKRNRASSRDARQNDLDQFADGGEDGDD